jgi:hypothetical protein
VSLGAEAIIAAAAPRHGQLSAPGTSREQRAPSGNGGLTTRATGSFFLDRLASMALTTSCIALPSRARVNPRIRRCRSTSGQCIRRARREREKIGAAPTAGRSSAPGRRGKGRRARPPPLAGRLGEGRRHVPDRTRRSRPRRLVDPTGWRPSIELLLALLLRPEWEVHVRLGASNRVAGWCWGGASENAGFGQADWWPSSSERGASSELCATPRGFPLGVRGSSSGPVRPSPAARTPAPDARGAVGRRRQRRRCSSIAVAWPPRWFACPSCHALAGRMSRWTLGMRRDVSHTPGKNVATGTRDVTGLSRASVLWHPPSNARPTAHRILWTTLHSPHRQIRVKLNGNIGNG